MHRKKILWIKPTTLGIFVHHAAEMEVLKHLAERGHEIYLFAGLNDLSSKKSFQAAYSRIHLILIPLRCAPIITPLLFAFIVFVFLPFFLLSKRPDFVVLEPSPSVICSLWNPLLRLSKCKAFLEIRSTPVLKPARVGLRGYLNMLCFNVSVAMAKKAFCGMTIVTELMKREICDKLHINPKFVGVWTNGVPTTLFKPESYDGTEMRKKLGLTDKFIIFYHGVFGFHRGIIESIKSIEILKNKHNHFVLFLLGRGPARSVLKELVQKSGIQDKVIIHNAVDYVDVPKFIAMCDVGIVPLPDSPNWRHQCPIKLLEYLAMKKVVIVTDIPANREVVGESKCGIYASSTDPKEIAKAIIYAYDNKDKLKKWGSDGRAIVEEKYSWKKVAKDFESFLLKC